LADLQEDHSNQSVKSETPKNYDMGGQKWGMELYFVYLPRKVNPLPDEVES
jgi:hypothetical protein